MAMFNTENNRNSPKFVLNHAEHCIYLTFDFSFSFSRAGRPPKHTG